MATKKGYELAAKLAPAIGYTTAISETCSAICRVAARLHRLNEDACNGPGDYVNSIPYPRAGEIYAEWEAKTDRDTERALKRLRYLVETLPETDSGPFTLEAESDPRGCSVIVAPEGIDVRRDSWGNVNGVCIP